MTRRKKLLYVVGAVLILLSIWLLVNPPGTFGFCRFGITTYNCIPYPTSDIQVRADGEMRRVQKTHNLQLTAVEWLLDPKPNVLIISTGWHGVVKVQQAITEIKQCNVELMKTGDAIRRFRELRKQGKKVAIHIHSTC